MCRPRHLLLLLLLMLGWPLAAQDFIAVSGIVTDQQTRRPLPHASVMADQVGTVTNEQGRFVLKVKPQTAALTVSLIGYVSQRVELGPDSKELRVQLKPSDVNLEEVVVRPHSAEELVRQAISKFPVNYSSRPTSYYGFYREVMQKRRQYISISEAVVEMYKTSYDRNTLFDAVAVCLGRRILNMKSADTLIVKLMGGPTLPVYADVVKNNEFLFYPDDMASFHYAYNGIEKLDDRRHYVVSMVPEQNKPYALFYATLYIDQNSLTISRADLHLDMRNRSRATSSMLIRRPQGLRFTPIEMTFNIYYRTEGNVTYLNYVRNEMRFKCDWHRRLFSSPFTIVSEFVVTNIKPEAKPIPKRDTFSHFNNLYDNAEYFSEPDFWGPDNIIEPTESLLRAIDRLRRSVKRSL